MRWNRGIGGEQGQGECGQNGPNGFFHGVNKFRSTLSIQINDFALARASSSLSASLPPPRALSGRPPPLPPTMGAICWIIFPAWVLAVKSGDTAATRETAPANAPPNTITPLKRPLRESTTA